MVHIFMINPSAGKDQFSTQLRQTVRKHKDIDFFLTNILYPGHEAILVGQLLKYMEGNKLRFYVCGGLCTLHKVINALDTYGKLSEVEIAWLAKGTNNFFKNAFAYNTSLFEDVDRLIAGEPRAIDYIRTNHGIAINAFSCGLDADIINQNQKLAYLGLKSSRLFYQWTNIRALLTTKSITASVSTDDYEANDSFQEVFFGNGSSILKNIKLSDNPIIDDGLCDYVIAPKVSKFNLYKIFKSPSAFIGSSSSIVSGSSTKLRISSDTAFRVNLDGVLYEDFNKWTVEIVKQGLQFVVPGGVGFNE